jgi:hypothetical protein
MASFFALLNRWPYEFAPMFFNAPASDCADFKATILNRWLKSGRFSRVSSPMKGKDGAFRQPVILERIEFQAAAGPSGPAVYVPAFNWR